MISLLDKFQTELPSHTLPQDNAVKHPPAPISISNWSVFLTHCSHNPCLVQCTSYTPGRPARSSLLQNVVAQTQTLVLNRIYEGTLPTVFRFFIVFHSSLFCSSPSFSHSHKKGRLHSIHYVSRTGSSPWPPSPGSIQGALLCYQQHQGRYWSLLRW